MYDQKMCIFSFYRTWIFLLKNHWATSVWIITVRFIFEKRNVTCTIYALKMWPLDIGNCPTTGDEFAINWRHWDVFVVHWLNLSQCETSVVITMLVDCKFCPSMSSHGHILKLVNGALVFLKNKSQRDSPPRKKPHDSALKKFVSFTLL